MTGPLYRLGGFSARRHRLVIAVWVVVAIGLVVAARVAGPKTNDNLSLPGTGSTQATDLLDEKLPQQENGTNPIVLQAHEGTLDDATNSSVVDETAKSLRNAPHVTSAVSPLGDQGSAALSKDRTIGYVSVTLDLAPQDLDRDEAEAVIDAADPARDAGMEVAVGGYLGQEVSKPSTHSSEAIGLTAAIVILLFAFGTVTAMALPIATAVLGLLSALSLITLLGHVVEVPSVAPTLATMIGLGVGIDYALFIVTRHKQQLRSGMEIQESVARATATAGGAVVFAGGTVMIALCSLGIAGIPLVTALGYSAAVAVVVAVAAATTLLPALLGALGPRIDSLRVKLGRTHPDDRQPHGWRRWAEGVARRPWLSLVASALILLVLALPARNLHLGQSDLGALSTDTTARQAYDLLSEGFGPGENGPLLFVVKLDPAAKPDSKKLDDIDQQLSQLQQQPQTEQVTSQEAQLQQEQKQLASPASDIRLRRLEDDVKDTPGVKLVTPATLDGEGDVAVFTAIATTAPSSRQTEDLVDNLRDDVIPRATQGTGLTAYVGGQTAGYIDLADQIGDKLPSMIAIVIGLSFLVLLLAFRSLVVPLKAAVATLLSVAAAYGVVTAVFQDGWGAQLIGLDGAIPIVSFVPLLMFAILFGLSMDYEVFLLSQMQEHYKESGEPRRAVVEGLANTGRVITSAALIMVCVFTSFILNGDPVVKEFGVGLAVAVAIDASIVRCVLVPAAMTLLGRSAWWLPRWMDRALPRISIEGEDYFAKRR
ncbi:MAG: MMPL family transporter [Solirubrobacterales bacterium]